MIGLGYGPISQPSLHYRLQRERPSNLEAESGYALVYVLSPQSFARGHIPMSINIPLGRIHEFARRFARHKEIVVYGDERSVPVSAGVARRLAVQGFTRVYDFEAGFSVWRDAGCAVECGAGECGAVGTAPALWTVRGAEPPLRDEFDCPREATQRI